MIRVMWFKKVSLCRTRTDWQSGHPKRFLPLFSNLNGSPVASSLRGQSGLPAWHQNSLALLYTPERVSGAGFTGCSARTLEQSPQATPASPGRAAIRSLSLLSHSSPCSLKSEKGISSLHRVHLTRRFSFLRVSRRGGRKDVN